MPSGKEFQKQLAQMDQRLTGIGSKTPLLVTVVLPFEPWLLEAAAADSKKKKCSLEDVILGAVRDKFADETDLGDDGDEMEIMR
jgi:hypothetical protein